MPDSGERVPPFRVHLVAALAAAISMVMALFWPVMVFFTCAFTWQATVMWCRHRWYVDGKNVWEHTYGDPPPSGSTPEEATDGWVEAPADPPPLLTNRKGTRIRGVRRED